MKCLRISVQTVRELFMFKQMVATSAHQPPYTGWLGQLLGSMRQLEHLDLRLLTDARGPHLAEGDLQALCVCPSLRHLNLNLDVALDLSYTALEAVTLLTQLTSLTLGLNCSCLVKRSPLPIPMGISALQKLQALGLCNNQWAYLPSNSACNIALQGVSVLTRLSF